MGTVLGKPHLPFHDAVNQAYLDTLVRLRFEPSFNAGLEPVQHALAGLLITSQAMIDFWSAELGLAGAYVPVTVAKVPSEPLTAPADLDQDGLANETEYANVMDSGGTLDDFWFAVVDPFAKGFPLPAVGGVGLLALSVVILLLYVLLVGRSDQFTTTRLGTTVEKRGVKK